MASEPRSSTRSSLPVTPAPRSLADSMASGGIGPVLVGVVTAEVDGVADGVRRGWADRGDAELGVTVTGAAELGSAGATGPGAAGSSAAYGVLLALRVRPTDDTTARTVNATTAKRGRKDFVTPSRRGPASERLSSGAGSYRTVDLASATCPEVAVQTTMSGWRRAGSVLVRSFNSGSRSFGTVPPRLDRPCRWHCMRIRLRAFRNCLGIVTVSTEEWTAVPAAVVRSLPANRRWFAL
ncbi:hypothetical protein GCM10009558_027630 [Virgisporangium aurantiacum]